MYDAAAQLGGWSVISRSLGMRFSSQQVILFGENATSGKVQSINGFGIDPPQLARFAAAVNAGMMPTGARLLPAGGAQRSSEWQSDSDFARSAFYNEAVLPMGGF
jgi:hypothetical protein